jgi:peptide/nickel transport system substrate-binding protein
MLVYSYIGLNVRDKILSDVKVRQALSMLINVDQIIDKVRYGKASRIIGPVLPSLKDDYNNDIKPYPFDMAKAKQLLAEVGWVDSDGDGVLDKVINGQKTPFAIVYTYNKGNPLRETVGLLCQQWFKQAGIKLEIKDLDWSLFQDEMKKGNGQMFYGSWILDPRTPDFKQIFHTSSRNGGSNYTGFGNAQTDALIEKINRNMDPASRSVEIKQFQQILHDEAPNIFLYTSNFLNVIHKRFEHVSAGPVYPGYWVAGFKVKDGYKVEGRE